MTAAEREIVINLPVWVALAACGCPCAWTLDEPWGLHPEGLATIPAEVARWVKLERLPFDRMYDESGHRTITGRVCGAEGWDWRGCSRLSPMELPEPLDEWLP